MIQIKPIPEVEYANPACNCCTEEAEIVIIFVKEVMNNTEKVISLCGDCYTDLQKNINRF